MLETYMLHSLVFRYTAHLQNRSSHWAETQLLLLLGMYLNFCFDSSEHLIIFLSVPTPFETVQKRILPSLSHNTEEIMFLKSFDCSNNLSAECRTSQNLYPIRLSKSCSGCSGICQNASCTLHHSGSPWPPLPFLSLNRNPTEGEKHFQAQLVDLRYH